MNDSGQPDSESGSHTGAEEFVRTLRRKHMVQIAIIYLGGAWVFMQAIGFFREFYGLSRKLLDLVILLAVLGFPAVMLIGWFHGEIAMLLLGEGLLLLLLLLVLHDGLLLFLPRERALVAQIQVKLLGYAVEDGIEEGRRG